MEVQKLRQSRKHDEDEDAREKLAGFIASKPVLLSAATFPAASGLSLAEPEKGSLLTAVKPYAPAVMSLAGSFLAGLIIGRIARHKLKHVLIAGGIVVVAALEVLRTHMRLPQLTGFPVLVKHKVDWIFAVLMQIVLQAALFSTGDIDQLFKLSLYQINFVIFGDDISGG